jgi:ATP-dependent DNA helicase RecG
MESRTLEFKRVSGKMVGKPLETLCAFANTNGGILVLGIGDPESGNGADRLFGIDENAEALEELRRKAATQFDPAIKAIEWLELVHRKLKGSGSSHRSD